MRTLHLLSHTHWDREWYQPFQQFRLRLVHLVDGLLDILASDPEYRHFMLDGQTVVLEDYLQIRPEREAELRGHIESGRIGIGPWYILPDEFLVSPEAHIRNLLEGDRICRAFGAKMMVGYIPDTFGHIGQLPQIARGFGMHTAGVWRGIDEVPNAFWWQAPDGSRVLAAYLRGGYGNAAGILAGGVESFAAEAAKLRDTLAAGTTSPHVLLMHGVDHQEADPRTSAAVAYANTTLGGDQMVHSTLTAYFAAIQQTLDLDALPAITGELRSARTAPLLPGVLSTRMWIKQRNQECQTLLERWAEPFSAWAEAAGASTPTSLRQPAAVLRQAWRLLLLCHPHDSICGCSIDAVHDEMRPRFDQVAQMGEIITQQSLEGLAAQVDTTGLPVHPGATVIVFNPTSGPRTDAASALVEALPGGGSVELVDDQGQPVPFQTVGLGGGEIINMAMSRKEFLDLAGFISGGVVMGQKIQETIVRREGHTVLIDTVLGTQGEPNIAAWEAGRAQLEEHLQDSAVTTIHVRACSACATQMRFAAPDIPAYGYRAFYVRGKPSEPAHMPQMNAFTRALLPLASKLASSPRFQPLVARFTASPASKPPYRIENEYFAVSAADDGTLEVLEKRSGTVYTGLNRFVDGGDRGDEYNYAPPPADAVISASLRQVIVQRGAVEQSLELLLELRVPLELAADRKSRSPQAVRLPVRARVTLTTGVPRIDLHTEVENTARDHRLRVHFPAPFGAQDALHDGHFHTVRRPVGAPAFDNTWIEQPRPEVPQRAFTCVHDGSRALLVANRGLPEVEVLRRADGTVEIALTLLRCVGWLSRDDFPERKGHAGPGEPTPGAQLPGTWAFDYAILPGSAAALDALYAEAEAFNAPLRAVVTGLHGGALPGAGSFIQSSSPAFAITAVKQAEDGRGWIVRGYNRSDTPQPVQLTSLFPLQTAERVNLAEEAQSPLPVAEGAVRFTAGAWEIVTVRLA